MSSNQNIRTEDAGSCFLCGMEGSHLYGGMRDRLFNAPGVWGFLRCPGCGLTWLSPRPTPEDNHKVYAEYFTHAGVEEVKPIPAPSVKKLGYYVLAGSFGYHELFDGPISRAAGKVMGVFPFRREMAGRRVMWLHGGNRGTLLEVGCGSGKFLASMRQLGWRVVGLEPDEKAAAAARERFGLEVMSGPLKEAGIPDGSFDAVAMGHVIEHAHDPMGLLTECGRVLRPGGELVVTTPNVESLGHRYSGRAWFPLDPPRHLHLFSVSTLRACAEGAGLRVKILRTTAHASRLIWAASRIIQREGAMPGAILPELGRSLRFERKVFQFVEYLLTGVGRDAGEELLMIAARGRG